MSNSKIATARAAIEELVADEKPHAGVANVDAWTTTVRTRIRAAHWDEIIGMLDRNPDLEPSDLADRIREAKADNDPRPTTAVQHVNDRVPCRQCGCYGGGGFLPMTERDGEGIVPGVAVPCPSCSIDRHRQYAAALGRENGAKW